MKDMKKIHQHFINAIIEEARQFPCFGLVSAVNPGCHQDMDCGLLIKAANSFEDYLLMIDHNITTIKEFRDLQRLGQQFDKQLLTVTEGINTHKGLIFSGGILYYALSCYRFDLTKLTKVSQFIKSFCQPLDNYYTDQLVPQTHGDLIYKKYRIRGARQMAVEGYAVLLIEAWQFYQQYLSHIKERHVINFLMLIYFNSKIDDTVILHKTNYLTFINFKKQCHEWVMMAMSNPYQAYYRAFWSNHYYSHLRISPGGCADLLINFIFLLNLR